MSKKKIAINKSKPKKKKKRRKENIKNTIKGMIRLAFRRSDLHNQATKNARIEVQEGHYKNGNPRIVVYWVCNKCKGRFKSDQIEIDHIVEIGDWPGSFDIWIDRMWCDITNLQALCKACHKLKGAQYSRDKASGVAYL